MDILDRVDSRQFANFKYNEFLNIHLLKPYFLYM